MGNSNSKPFKKILDSKKSTEEKSPPSVVRTDTIQSTKSRRSLRSLKSKKSDTSISKNGADGSGGTLPLTSTKSDDLTNTLSFNSKTGLSYSHSRDHSMSRVPTSEDTNNRYLSPDKESSSRRASSTRRSSLNTGNIDLPPSMIQVKPKEPILKNKNYISSSNSFSYNENALTDDEDDDEKNSTNPKRLDILRHSYSSRPSSSRSGSFSSKSRRKSENGQDLNDSSVYLPISRSASHGSAHSRRSSMNSLGTNAYSTPLNSPAIKTQQMDDSSDYFTHSGGSSNIGNIQSANDFNLTPSTSINDQSKRWDSLGYKETNSSFPKINIKIDLDDDELRTMDNNDMNIYHSGDPDLHKKKKIIKIVDIDETIQKLLDAGYAAKRTKNVCLKNSEIAQICHRAREMFLAQPPLLELSPPVKIVGDVHGQYSDLLRLFTKCGFPPSANYLFLGDYVDRGKQSLETILLLLCYKIKYPENFFLLRGNHESANVTRVYGFYDECKRRCNIRTWKYFVDTFNSLPLAAIVTGKIFCVHGGLSPVLNSMDEIRHVSRPTDVPDFGLINDLLWSDPTDSPNEWEDNERGVSYCYNKVAINKFLNKFGFDLVCRAHMVVEDGYEFFNDRSLVTVFSAPNYCGEFDNWGAVMSVSQGLLCSFELLDPLDSSALKQVMKKGRHERKIANQQQQQFQ